MTSTTSSNNTTLTFTTAIQPPPGQIVAPNGFPANPRPPNAPQTFLDAMDVRIKVFCDEQHCAIEPELDEDDPKSWSWVVYSHSAPSTTTMTTTTTTTTPTPIPTPVSTIRLVPPPHPPHPNGFTDPTEEPYLKLTRVATLAVARGKGLSKRLCDEALTYFSRQPDAVGEGWRGLVLTHAQVEVERMYAKMGFVTDERLGRWLEEGIEHVGMWKRLKISCTQ